jgi:hypothetical protein
LEGLLEVWALAKAMQEPAHYERGAAQVVEPSANAHFGFELVVERLFIGVPGIPGEKVCRLGFEDSLGEAIAAEEGIADAFAGEGVNEVPRIPNERTAGSGKGHPRPIKRNPMASYGFGSFFAEEMPNTLPKRDASGDLGRPANTDIHLPARHGKGPPIPRQIRRHIMKLQFAGHYRIRCIHPHSRIDGRPTRAPIRIDPGAHLGGDAIGSNEIPGLHSLPLREIDNPMPLCAFYAQDGGLWPKADVTGCLAPEPSITGIARRRETHRFPWKGKPHPIPPIIDKYQGRSAQDKRLGRHPADERFTP